MGRPHRGRLKRDREAEAGGAREVQSATARELAAAERAFQRGDWSDAARRARQAERTGSDAVKGAADATLGRFRTDPVVPLLFAIALVFLILSVIHYA